MGQAIQRVAVAFYLISSKNVVHNEEINSARSVTHGYLIKHSSIGG